MLTGVDELDIQALVDGQLKDENEQWVRRVVEHEPALFKRYQELAAQKRLIQSWWAKEAAPDSGEAAAWHECHTFILA